MLESQKYASIDHTRKMEINNERLLLVAGVAKAVLNKVVDCEGDILHKEVDSQGTADYNNTIDNIIVNRIKNKVGA